MSDEKKLILTKRQLQGLLNALTLEFILGVILTTVVGYDPTKPNAFQTTILVLHIIIAIGIIIGSIMRIAMSIRWHTLLPQAVIGIIGVAVAFGSGMAAANDGNDIAVLLMSLGFITALLAYGHGLFTLTDRTNRKHTA
jgi:uncharacterized membrane protein HdeD (DUF308 family)